MKTQVNFYNADAKEEADEPWGIETQIDLHDCDAGIIRNADMIKEYVYQLCDLIKMKRYGDCTVVNFGEDEKVAGFSMIQLIETSCISAHFANATNRVFMNIFSCKKYDVDAAVRFTSAFFKAGKVNKVNVTERD